MWEVVKDRVVLNQPVVPKDDGIRLPLHSDLRRNAGADGVKKKPKQKLGFGFSESIDATGESFIHIQRYIPCFRNLPHNGVMTGRQLVQGFLPAQIQIVADGIVTSGQLLQEILHL